VTVAFIEVNGAPVELLHIVAGNPAKPLVRKDS